jgi:hypothetical protein
VEVERDPTTGQPNMEQITKNFEHLSTKFAAKKLTFNPARETAFEPSTVHTHFLEARSAFTPAGATYPPQLEAPPPDLDKINKNFKAIDDALTDYQIIHTTALSESDATPPDWADVMAKFGDLDQKLAQKGLQLQLETQGAPPLAVAKRNFDKIATAFELGLDDVNAGGGTSPEVMIQRKKIINKNFRTIKKAYDVYQESMNLSPQVEGNNQPADFPAVQEHFDQLARLLPGKRVASAARLRCANTAKCPQLTSPAEAQKEFERVARSFNPPLKMRKVEPTAGQGPVFVKKAINANFETIRQAFDVLTSSRSYYEWTWYQDEIEASESVCEEED